MTVFLQLRSATSGAPFVGSNQDDTVLWDTTARAWYVGPGGGAGAVSSVFGRTGAVVAATGDYDGDQVDNVSSVPGASVSDALEYLEANAGAVASVFSRTGVVVAATGDYDSDQIDNLSGAAGSSVSDALDDLLDLVGAEKSRTVVANFAFVAADAGGVVFVDSAGAVSATINDGVFPASTPTSRKSLLTVVQLGAGQVTIVGGGAQVIRTDLTAKAFGQYAAIGALQSPTANEWIAIGDRALA